MKLFNAQSEKTMADLDNKVLDTEFLKLVGGGMLYRPNPPKLPTKNVQTEETILFQM